MVDKKRFKVGSRPSPLALAQAHDALNRIAEQLGPIDFEVVSIASVGDGDRTTDLRNSSPDFFTRELDEAVQKGTVDFAIHSAKDIPDPLSEGLALFWLPWREDPSDALVVATGRSLLDLPTRPVVGVSSDRRAQYCIKRFPQAELKSIRGNIGERLAQLDAGVYDLLVIATAALNRLGLADRITERIPLTELSVPTGQGCLAITYRQGDDRMEELRQTLAIQNRPRILLTCSEALQAKAVEQVRALGGEPLGFPLIRLCRRTGLTLASERFDWVVVSSPSAVHFLVEQLDEEGLDRKQFPALIVCGPRTAEVAVAAGFTVAAQPEKDFSAAALVVVARSLLKPGDRVLRIRSDRAGPALADALRRSGAEIEDLVLYENERIIYDSLPEFDAVFFASTSAVESFIGQWGVHVLQGKRVVVIGQPTARALERHGRLPDGVAAEATVASAIVTLFCGC